MRKNSLWSWVVLLCVITVQVKAASLLPLTVDEQSDRASAIFRGTVLQQNGFTGADGGIYTRTILRVDEVFKGKFPQNVQVVHRGGRVGDNGEVDSFSPIFAADKEYLLFLARRDDGSLFAQCGVASAILLKRDANGGNFTDETDALLRQLRQTFPKPAAAGDDVTDQAAQPSSSVIGGLMESSGVSSRFIAPDRGEKIPYIVDAQALPAGITLAQALNAVSNAFRAWSQVSSAQFVYEGTQNFGQAAANVPTTDRKIRVQLHDLHNFITESGVLGKGGRALVSFGSFPTGGNGGKVGSREFFESTRGYVVLEHTASTMQTLTSFEEVLCHEIGHVLSLDHSSETFPEPNTTLQQATMYFQVHADGRGATLGVYDPPIMRLVHPTNTPPYSYERVMDIVTASPAPNVAGINEVDIRGYDLQADSLTITVTNQTANNGTFSLVSNNIKYAPAAAFSDATRVDPLGGSFYDVAYVRLSDATNGSPWIPVRVISYLRDSQPSTSDGMPNSWMTQYFGTTTPSAGSKTRAQDDFDGDGVTNLNEFIAGTSPADADSNLRITTFATNALQWSARIGDVYEIHQSADLASWSLGTNPVRATNATQSIGWTNSLPHQFLRIERVP